MKTCKCSNPVIVAPNPPEIRCLICGGIVPPPTSEELAAMEPTETTVLWYNVVYPFEIKIGDYAYLEADLPQRREDFRCVTGIAPDGKNYLFYQEDSPFEYPIEGDVLVFTLRGK